MKTVTSLPNEIIQNAESFMYRQKRYFLNPAFYSFIILASEFFLGLWAYLLIATYLSYLFFISKTSKIIWQGNKTLWFLVNFSMVGFSVGAKLLLQFDLNSWFIHEYGYIHGDSLIWFFLFILFIPYLAASLITLEKLEHYYYKFHGYDYVGPTESGIDK
ncbi:hypothetical protein [Thalassotalea mangrovi]|uniref:Uncharacterized protein n=1 Tax=Thalassotalea mangrovi TaxID=2572245 RepID=A0A4U1B5T8_9GAMM|nr:hypothetical protein [Thalassotalea mangrovi]TKB45670.1 hypothetical protein E8M12_07860 [Thalassotalea mangrovi]